LPPVLAAAWALLEALPAAGFQVVGDSRAGGEVVRVRIFRNQASAEADFLAGGKVVDFPGVPTVVVFRDEEADLKRSR
jgi:hypothetical protein